MTATAPIKTFDASDVEALTDHSQSVGWYAPADWATFLNHGAVLGHVADTKIHSSACVSEFADDLAWLGAFIVNPSQQGRGLGRALLESCVNLTTTAGRSRFGLVSTVEGQRLYRSGGFETVATTHKLVTEKGFTTTVVPPPTGLRVRRLQETDWPRIETLDLDCVGARRGRLLRQRAQASERSFVLADSRDIVQGFIFGALDVDRVILGPVCAPETQSALGLITAMTASSNGCTRIDVLDVAEEVIAGLRSSGFSLERVCPVMTLSGKGLGYSRSYFALVAQAFG